MKRIIIFVAAVGAMVACEKSSVLEPEVPLAASEKDQIECPCYSEEYIEDNTWASFGLVPFGYWVLFEEEDNYSKRWLSAAAGSACGNSLLDDPETGSLIFPITEPEFKACFALLQDAIEDDDDDDDDDEDDEDDDDDDDDEDDDD